MRPPRFGSRPDRHAITPAHHNDASARLSPERMVDIRPRAHGDVWDDPGRLIESWLQGRDHRAYSPETVLVAWLSILAPSIPPPQAAGSLLNRLESIHAIALSGRQRRLVDLLTHVAAHACPPAPPAETDIEEVNPS